MKLAELTVADFTQTLASDAPAPGGGSVSALCAANGAALCAMVARLTQGKKKYMEFDGLMAELIPQAEELRRQLLISVGKDTEAFNLVSAAFKMPKETEEQKAARSAKIAEGMVVSTKVPFETMELTAQALKLAQQLLGKFNTNAASDLGVAALNLSAALRGAWLNVLINLGSLKDAQMAQDYRARGRQLAEESQAIADEIYQAILASLS